MPEQRHSPLRTVTNVTLLVGIASCLAWACVSSNSDNNTATGGASGTIETGGSGSTDVGGGNAGGGGNTPQGGVNGTGGTTASLPDCNLTTGVVTGNACTPNPSQFTIQDNTPGTGATGTSCPLAVWANDGTSSGYFFLPWCNTAGGSDCTLSMACSGGTIHVTGNYMGGGTGIDGNAGFGLNLQTTYADAGPGCQMISGAGLTGLTLNVTDTTVPGNHFLVGLTLANGNAAEYTANLAAGAQTVKIPWASFTNKKTCGGVPGPGIVGFYFVFDWFSSGSHDVDMTMSNLGFY